MTGSASDSVMAKAKTSDRIDAEKGALVPMEFDDSIMWAAWLYYADEMTQSEIAKRLNVSRATIVNYLQEARERGIVSVNIHPKAGSRTSIARALMAKFDLAGAFVIPDGDEQALTQRLGDAGARVLADQVEDNDTIGVAWGRTVLAVADQISLTRPARNVTVVQVSGSSTGEADFSPELCTSLLSNRIHARCVNLLAPAVLSTKALKALLLAEPVLRKQMDLVHSANRILFGVGDIGPKSTVRQAGIAEPEEIDDYVARGATAVIIGRFIDAHGGAVGGPHDERVVGITLDELKNVPSRICVAGGPTKIRAIIATLEAGYVTHFITDMATAEALIAAPQ
ncbi:DNA-binding transcriptional regulator LsrR (DeoR family) [Rhizobium sp. PP-F2F-G38]|uniref:Sugar-binding transcriptional regulator n=2 Tax=Hyphomicrobiales TaxID=356 RepID=A0AA43ZDD0_9HYPH|nr:sugar-binding transcriptional regulator [Ferranicluibacter rubi]PYE32575.1 DNA-binding transcriptional regulator LsrR (DeoR family) [Rhizobium sp. PP-WC-1G-195]PYE96004.1 DNA-binding transcriptional regulator LsrR (DeoR family) [Rhizobium sp. PP-F2F-G38]TCP88391.1 DNA-binding transcriptional regulator LsrR (DeoR family) [Rhizobium sp. PP-CC-2G-626]TCQ22944.1 DNA-binding transcriptional regulator LsrR (DeoR family) [Rhizobium sp. PP-CC-3G-465]